MLPFELARIFLDRSSTLRLLGYTVLGFAFSLSVILGTIGLMDGFESSLKSGLRRAAGDAILTSRNGFFKVDTSTKSTLMNEGATSFASIIQSEAFVLSEGRSKAVLVRGVDSSEFTSVTKLPMALSEQSVVVGSVLALEWSLNVGDTLTLVLARGQATEMPQFIEFSISQIITHGLYEKDSRMVYVNHKILDEIFGLNGKSNLAIFSFGENIPISKVEEKVDYLREEIDSPWIIKTSWQEFSGILEAVAVEKKSIAIVLQLIVLVAVFNIAAFLIALRIRKAQEYFLLRAVGLPKSRFYKFGAVLLLVLWILSCVGAWLLIQLFNWLLANVSWLQVPGDVYLLTRLQVLLDTEDYVLVFGPALLWVMLLGWATARKLSQQSLLTGLRQEFA